MYFVPIVLALGGIALGVVGYLGLTERLPRNRYSGVRTPATMRGDRAFRVGNKVAGPPTLAGGVVGLAGAILAWAMPTDGGLLTVVIVGTAVMLTLTIVGGVRGARAAAEVTDPDS